MANYGLFGSASAIAMAGPPEARSEQRQDDALAAAGFKDARAGEYEDMKREFLRVAPNSKMNEAAFVAHVKLQHHWGLDDATARAAFRACDVDQSGLLNTHEYALLRGALGPSFDRSRDAGTPLEELRLRTVFTKYAGDPGARMNAAQRRLLVRDLAGGARHVAETIEALLWPSDDAEGQMGCAEWISAARSGRLEKAKLDPLCLDHQDGPSPRLVLDPRCVLADGPRKKSMAVGPSLVNAELVLDEALRAPHGADWRGALAAPRGSAPQTVAEAAIEACRAIARDLERGRGSAFDDEEEEEEEDIPDSQWAPAALEELLETADPATQTERIVELAKDVARLAAAEPVVPRVAAPAKIFGDVHGQLRDLLLLLGHHGFPSHRGGDIETVAYVFNGDWVDRGAHQLEVVVLLFSLKVLYPARVFLVRGNHEFRRQNEGMGEFGFARHCATRLGGGNTEAYDAIHSAFDYLPLAAVVAEAIFVVHGGVGDGSWTIEDLSRVQRPLRDTFGSKTASCVRHALWSDPSDSDADMARGVHYLSRGDKGYRGSGIPKFGPDITAQFCHRESLQMVVRSHQFVRAGVKFMHGGRLATLFSARNYFDQNSNDAALLLIAVDEQGALRLRAKRLAHLCSSNNNNNNNNNNDESCDNCRRRRRR
ncbi:hypothetical protein CTAYLR_002607 [Chrysophaeum taylorii]|uniref:Serine/threonine-protein phosphatase n=1 Tax=Chrysophaeum taylorii TaxID=2483200 RepID=A0AAD7UDB4_9STRA|nr:hypothetical protein CTAYLR_002607 [Chrysophaeum taylorii]